MSPDDARKEPRVKTTDVVVRYSAATVEEFIEKHAHDVSRGGMCVRTPTPLATGTLVAFEIRTANDTSVVAGVGRVVWRRDNPLGDRPAGMGVKFIDVDDVSQAVIDRLVAANKGPGSEFELGPGDTTRTKTVLGMGSVVTAPAATPAPVPAAPASSPKAASPPVARTQLGLAPPILPAKLVLGEQSAAGAHLPAPRPPSTSDIDEEWLADKVEAALPSTATNAAAPPVLAPEPPKAEPLKTVVLSPPEPRATPAEPTKRPAVDTPGFAKPFRAEAQPTPDPEPVREEKRASSWPWVLFLVAAAAAGAAYYYRAYLNRSGLHAAMVDVGLASEPPAPAPTPTPTVSAAPIPSAPPPPPVAASASEAPLPAAPVASVIPSARASASASSRAPHPPAKPHPPKPKDEDNPF